MFSCCCCCYWDKNKKKKNAMMTTTTMMITVIMTAVMMTMTTMTIIAELQIKLPFSKAKNSNPIGQYDNVIIPRRQPASIYHCFSWYEIPVTFTHWIVTYQSGTTSFLVGACARRMTYLAPRSLCPTISNKCNQDSLRSELQIKTFSPVLSYIRWFN